LLKYLTCLRPVNLVIVFLTQIIFYYVLFDPTEVSTQENLRMYPILIHVFATITVLITASGYLINDYFDYETDVINRKTAKIPKYHNLMLYYTIVFFGFGMAWWMADYVGNVSLSIIYLGAILMLYLYSARWKRKVLIGNLVVAGFTAGVPLILLVAEWDFLQLQEEAVANEIVAVLLIFGVFAFLINLTREIIKDIEDMEGDKAAGYRTLPLTYGLTITKRVAGGVSLILLSVISLTCMTVANDITPLLLVMVGLVAAQNIYLIIKLLWSKDLNPCHTSKVSKFMMLTGLILVIVYRLEL